MMTTTRKTARRPRLALNPLERRDTPAGSVAAAFSGGVLTLYGDAADNTIQIGATNDGTGADVVLSGDDTQITGGSEFEGVRSIRVFLRGGDDAVSADPAAPFVLAGSALFDLGDGNNSLDLRPADDLFVGNGLTVKAAAGVDAVHIAGPEGGRNRIGGTVDLNYGEGNSTTELNALMIGDSLKIIAGEGEDTVTTDGVHIGQPVGGSGALSGSVQMNGGKGPLTVTTIDSAFPATTLTARGNLSLTVTGGSYNGLAMTTPGDASASFTDAFVRRDVSVAAGPAGAATLAFAGQDVSAGQVKVRGGAAAVTIADAPTAYLGGLDVVGKSARFETDGSDVRVGGAAVVRATHGSATMSAGGTRMDFLKGLTVAGSDAVAVSFATTGTGTQASSVGGHLIVSGGAQNDVVQTNGNFRVGGDVRVTTGAGDDRIELGGEDATSTIGGRLTVATGVGDDTIVLTRLIVGGATAIDTGGGNDTVALQNDSTYRGAVAIDQGAGDDTLVVGTDAGGVKFNKLVTAYQGGGNDTLAVGLTDDGTGVTFNRVGSQFHGGAGMDTLTEGGVEASGLEVNVAFTGYELRA